MRDYAKVGPQFWIGDTGRKLREAGGDAQRVALYLITSPHANMLGMYYLPIDYIAHDVGMTIEGASEGLRRVIEAGLCVYDHEAECVWVYEMARFQIAEELSGDDKRCKGIQNEYDVVPRNKFLPAFYQRYATAFNLKKCRGMPSPIEGASKGLRSQEQEQEQKQEQKQEKINTTVGLSPDVAAPNPTPPPLHLEPATAPPAANRVAKQVNAVFAHWQRVHDHPTAKLGDSGGKRYRAIAGRIKDGYTVAQLCLAVDGCKRSPPHMGQNERGMVYDDIELICRDAAHVDKFLKLASGPNLTTMSAVGRANVAAAQRFLERDEKEGDHHAAAG